MRLFTMALVAVTASCVSSAPINLFEQVSTKNTLLAHVPESQSDSLNHESELLRRVLGGGGGQAAKFLDSLASGKVIGQATADGPSSATQTSTDVKLKASVGIFDDVNEPLIKLRRPALRVAPAPDTRQVPQLAHDLKRKASKGIFDDADESMPKPKLPFKTPDSSSESQANKRARSSIDTGKNDVASTPGSSSNNPLVIADTNGQMEDAAARVEKKVGQASTQPQQMASGGSKLPSQTAVEHKAATASRQHASVESTTRDPFSMSRQEVEEEAIMLREKWNTDILRMSVAEAKAVFTRMEALRAVRESPSTIGSPRARSPVRSAHTRSVAEPDVSTNDKTGDAAAQGEKNVAQASGQPQQSSSGAKMPSQAAAEHDAATASKQHASVESTPRDSSSMSRQEVEEEYGRLREKYNTQFRSMSATERMTVWARMDALQAVRESPSTIGHPRATGPLRKATSRRTRTRRPDIFDTEDKAISAEIEKLSRWSRMTKFVGRSTLELDSRIGKLVRHRKKLRARKADSTTQSNVPTESAATTSPRGSAASPSGHDASQAPSSSTAPSRAPSGVLNSPDRIRLWHGAQVEKDALTAKRNMLEVLENEQSYLHPGSPEAARLRIRLRELRDNISALESSPKDRI